MQKIYCQTRCTSSRNMLPRYAPEDSDSQSEDGDFKCPSYSGEAPESMKLTKKGTVTLELPKNVFKSQEISTMADRFNMSAGERTAFMAAVITDGGVNLDDVTLSKTSTRHEAKCLLLPLIDICGILQRKLCHSHCSQTWFLNLRSNKLLANF